MDPGATQVDYERLCSLHKPLSISTLLSRRGDGRRLLKTRDGIKFYARENIWDARILREVFVQRPYLRGFTDIPPSPIVVDIGGTSGTSRFTPPAGVNAAQVIVYEPTSENWAMLKDNIALNGLDDRVTPVNQAVGGSGTLVLNVESSGQEIHSSSYWYPDAVKREVPSVTLDELMAEHGLAKIDPLKIDCEGGEYDIIKCASDDALARVGRVTLEWHTGEDLDDASGANGGSASRRRVSDVGRRADFATRHCGR